MADKSSVISNHFVKRRASQPKTAHETLKQGLPGMTSSSEVSAAANLLRGFLDDLQANIQQCQVALGRPKLLPKKESQQVPETKAHQQLLGRPEPRPKNEVQEVSKTEAREDPQDEGPEDLYAGMFQGEPEEEFPEGLEELHADLEGQDAVDGSCQPRLLETGSPNDEFQEFQEWVVACKDWAGNRSCSLERSSVPRHEVSRSVNALLRHGKVGDQYLDMAGIMLDSGYCLLDVVASILQLSKECVLQMVSNDCNSKFPRFEHTFWGRDCVIRAVQGHSLPRVQLHCMFEALSVTELQVRKIAGAAHITSWWAKDEILITGLLPGRETRHGGRTAIHLVPVYCMGPKLQELQVDKAQAEHVDTWARGGCWIYVDIFQAMLDGLVFFQNSAQIILTDKPIDVKYLTEWL
jgi:RNA:NAD 2'-phosphotransferase (TPT1/KptA family)